MAINTCCFLSDGDWWVFNVSVLINTSLPFSVDYKQMTLNTQQSPSDKKQQVLIAILYQQIKSPKWNVLAVLNCF